jgi:hypothetical protein
MIEAILRDIDMVYKKGDVKHILNKYIDRDYWLNDLSNSFRDNYIENFTGFDYSTGFTMYINISDVLADVGSKEFDKYIENFGCLYRIQLQISVIGSYAAIKYIKYEYNEGNIMFNDSYGPFIDEHVMLENKVKEFLMTHKLNLLSEEQLSTEVEDISLELRESHVTVYHCLFEDGY